MVPDLILQELESRRNKRVHFIGIGGIGMAALARWFLAQKWAVTGSDLVASALTKELEKEGVRFVLGHKKGLVGSADIIIRSQAILPTNIEYQEAIRGKIPITTYPEIIGSLTRRYQTIAIAGAHGKSTTTSLVALIMTAAKLDPTVIVGTKLKEFNNKNFRAGKGRFLILEADEYGRAFLNYSPHLLLITNIDREHLDTYHNLADIKKTFLDLIKRVAKHGTVVLNADNENLIMLQDRIDSIARANRIKVLWYSLKDKQARRIRAILKIPGAHNLSNAVGAYALARKALHIKEEAVLRSLGAFYGSWRRYEYKGSYKLGATNYDVYDDYAHHPTEIKATLAAFREKFPKRALICVFQPHQAERLKRLFPEFKRSFDAADALLLLPEYRVAGRDVSSAFTSQALAASITKRRVATTVFYLDNPEKNLDRAAVRELLLRTGLTGRDAVIIMMGAGNIVDLTNKLL